MPAPAQAARVGHAAPEGADPRGSAASNSNADAGVTPLDGGTVPDESDESLVVPDEGDMADSPDGEVTDLFGLEPTGSTSQWSSEPMTTSVLLGALAGIVLTAGAWTCDCAAAAC